jgi:hypothetical protein
MNDKLQHAVVTFTCWSHSNKTTGMPALSVAHAMPVPIVPSPTTAIELTGRGLHDL